MIVGEGPRLRPKQRGSASPIRPKLSLRPSLRCFNHTKCQRMCTSCDIARQMAICDRIRMPCRTQCFLRCLAASQPVRPANSLLLSTGFPFMVESSQHSRYAAGPGPAQHLPAAPPVQGASERGGASSLGFSRRYQVFNSRPAPDFRRAGFKAFCKRPALSACPACRMITDCRMGCEEARDVCLGDD